MTYDPRAHARRDDPETSHISARLIAAKAESSAVKLLLAFAGAGTRGMTDEEAGLAAGVRRPDRRGSDLRNAGLIIPNGEVKTTSLGMPARVCVITNRGRYVLAERGRRADHDKETP